MKILAISGSPRCPGNTLSYLKIALQEAEKLGAEVELISLAGLNISGCIGCYGCVTKKECVVEDDFQKVFDAMKHSEGIIIGSPVYHASITSALKAVLDRAGFSGRWAKNPMAEKDQAYQWGGCVFSGKVIAPVAIARRTGHTAALSQILLWATVNDCIVLGNTYWNMAIAGKGGAINSEEDAEGVSIMENLGKKMFHVMQKLQ